MLNLLVDGRDPVALAPADFVGSGGQASVYAKGDTAYKVFADPACATPRGKIQELAALSDPRVLRPLAALTDAAGRPVGHAMRYLAGALPLGAACSRAFRERSGLGPAEALDLALGMRAGLAGIHAAGVRVVDLNPMNLLLAADLREVYFIDADSYQTPSFPASALQDGVRDRLAPPGRFDAGTDWFAFAIVSFQLLIGIHPFKGKHATLHGLDARMLAQVSVLDRSVTIPAACYPLSVLPDGWLRWYEAVFHRAHRGPPPDGGGVVAALAAAAAGDATLRIEELADLRGPVVALATWGDRWYALAGGQLYEGGRRVGPAPLGAHIAFTGDGRPIVAGAQDGRLRLWDPGRQEEIPLSLQADQVTSFEGRILLQSGGQILEVGLYPLGAKIVAAASPLAPVLPRATRLFAGAAAQDLLGACWLSLFPAPGVHHQRRAPELDGYRLLHARLAGRSLLVLAEKAGRFDRLRLDFSLDFSSYTLDVAEDVPPQDPEVLALPGGRVLELGASELRLSRGDQRRVVPLPPGAGGLRLAAAGGRVLGARGAGVYSLSLA